MADSGFRLFRFFRGLDPRKWHLMTWAALLLWLLFSILSNQPFGKESVADNFDDEVLNSSGPVSNVSYAVAIGWPLPYLQHTVTPPSKNVTTDFLPHFLAVNSVAVALTLASLVFAMQRFGQFTLRYLMGVVLLVALTIVCGKWVVSMYDGLGLYIFFMALYFSPIVVVFTIGLYHAGVLILKNFRR